MDIQTIIYAAIGGVVPPLLWLWFWDREDRAHPEPKRMIILTFIAGALTVPLVIPFQKYAKDILVSTPLILIAWSSIEEILKFAVAYFVVLTRKVVDEPIDMIIYMLTIALGFSALENALYLFTSLQESTTLASLYKGNSRFIGATLLHVLASSSIGVAMAFAFYKKRIFKIIITTIGLIFAIIIHSLFNISLVTYTGANINNIFIFVWIGLIFLLLAFEKVKRIRHR